MKYAKKYGPDVLKTAKKIAPYVSQLMAAGYSQDEAEQMAAGAFVGGNGGILTQKGGKRISSRQLRQMLTM